MPALMLNLEHLLEGKRMKNISFSSKFYLRLLICLVLIVIPSCIAQSDKAANVDDLFRFLLENWANQHNVAIGDEGSYRGQPVPGLPSKSNREEVIISFREKVVVAENRFGQLPEYWELRSFLDLTPEDRQRGGAWGDNSPWYFSLRPDDARINPLVLQKAIDIDPHLGTVKFVIRSIEVSLKYPKGVDAKDPQKADELKDYRTLLADALADAGAAEPSNGYYPFIEASYRYLTGDDAKAMELLKRTVACEYFKYPRLFPTQYALDHMDVFEKDEGVFKNITPGGKNAILLNCYYNLDSTANSSYVKHMYEDLIKKTISEGEWQEILTTLNRAACMKGKGEEYDNLNSLIAAALSHLCMKGALSVAKAEGDKTLEAAILAAESERLMIKSITRVPNAVQDSTEMITMFVCKILKDYQLNQRKELGKPEPQVTWPDFSNPLFGRRVDHDVFREFIKPIFESLETFDFANPQAWYDARIDELFPVEK